MRQSYETRESLDSLLDEGRYQEFLDAAANLDESDVAEIVCDFAWRLIDQVPELGLYEVRDMIEDFRERVVKVYPSSWEIRSKFNSTIRRFIGVSNAARQIEEAHNYSHGTRQITQAELIQELNQILEFSPRKAHRAYRELVGSIALETLPPGINAVLSGALMRFSMDGLKRIARSISYSWA